MRSRAVRGPRGPLSIPSGAAGPRRARAGAAPSQAADSHPLAAALRGRQPGSAPAGGRAASETQAGGLGGGAGPGPARGKVLRSERQAREGWGRVHPARRPHPNLPARHVSIIGHALPPRPLLARPVAPSPLPAATWRCETPPGPRSGGRAGRRAHLSPTSAALAGRVLRKRPPAPSPLPPAVASPVTSACRQAAPALRPRLPRVG